MARQDAAEAFWRFSLMVYGRPGVAEALIRLQDRGGHNVNLVLFGLWVALCEGARLDIATLSRAKEAMTVLDGDVVSPLRRLRRALKENDDPDVHDLRRRVLVIEIAAERRVQARLAASIAGRQRRNRVADRHAACDANLRLILGSDFTSEETELLRRMIAAP